MEPQDTHSDLDAAGVTADGLPWALLGDLEDGTRGQRVHAVDQLRTHGTAAMRPICEALRDPDPEVRTAAAEALAEIGDERAIGPLSDAIRDQFVGHSMRWNRLWRVVRFPVYASAVCSVLSCGFGFFMSGWVWFAVGFCIWMAVGLGQSRPTAEAIVQRRLVGALVAALKQVTRRHPAPEACGIVPELRALASSKPGGETLGWAVLQEARRTADLIEEATAARLSLPLPAPGPDADSMPRTAGPPEQESKNLPRMPEHRPDAPTLEE